MLPAHIDHLQVTLPAVLIVVAFLLKLFIDRSATVPDIISAVLELPVDVAFLATTLVAGFAIGRPDNAALGVSLFAFYIAAAILVVVLWRRSYKLFTGQKYWWSVPLGVLNYALCGFGLVHAIQLVAPAVIPGK